jgi:hypothetical protein
MPSASAIAHFIPRPRLREVDRVAVATNPYDAWRVVRGMDLYQSRIVHALFDARTLPDRLAAWLRGKEDPAPKSSRLDDIVDGESGFRRLAEVAGREFVAGAIGKFWEPRIPFVQVTPEAFADFHEPGFGKVAWSVEVYPRLDGGSWLGVDLRVDATDDDAWLHFLPYWALIGRFSRLIRKTLLRSFVKRLGAATRDEDRGLPGDAILPVARFQKTHAITIEAPTQDVWPWLVQMGCRRAGWYSLDRLDNDDVRSAERIIPELQHIAVGDILPATPTGSDGFSVLRVDAGRSLVLGSPNLLAADASSTKERNRGMFGASYGATWAFFLDPIGNVATRLTVRVRADFDPSVRMEVTRPVILLVHDIMEHAQLRNLKRRAEAMA